MKAFIYSPTRNAMQSGHAKAGQWEVVFKADVPPSVDPVMGWMGMPDTTQQVKLQFSSREQAVQYAKDNFIEFEVVEPKQREIKPKSYSENFAFKPEIRS